MIKRRLKIESLDHGYLLTDLDTAYDKDGHNLTPYMEAFGSIDYLFISLEKHLKDEEEKKK